MLRYRRKWDSAGRRRYYRKIAHEKKRLILLGVDSEEIRLFCRFQSNLRNIAAKDRFYSYLARPRSSPVAPENLT